MIRGATEADLPRMLEIYAPYILHTTVSFEYTVPTAEEFLERFDEFKADTGARLTGILLDRGECFEFSLRRFADKVYRTSELEEDEIVERTIHTFTR